MADNAENSYFDLGRECYPIPVFTFINDCASFPLPLFEF